ncbi:MAG: nuclear transport factor 2 family protein [Pyrinomonadaceae bacterium]
MRYILGLLILVSATFAGAFGQCSDADKKALEAFDRAWGMAGETGDKAALLNLYADEYMGLPGMQGKIATIDNTMKSFERDKANPAMADKVTHDSYMISCTPNSATITHRNIIWTPDGTGGKPETFWTRSVHFLEKRGGKWQVVSNTGGGVMDDNMTLGYLEQDWNDAFWKRDKAWFETNFASDFSSISSMDGALTGKAKEIENIVNNKSTYNLVETTGMNIRMEGNTAVVTGVFHLKGKDEKGAAFDHSIRYTDTWIKRDGHWQAWASQGTRMP